MSPVIVFVTASSLDEARKIADALLDAKLAACANIIPGLESHYWWQGKRETATEFLLLIKTSLGQFDAVSETVKKHHSYECPEIVALAPEAVEAKYLQWWGDELKA